MAPQPTARAGSGGEGVASWAFDFGPSRSPRYPGYVGIDARQVYAKEKGFGWITQSAGGGVPGLSERDRGTEPETGGHAYSENALYRDFVMSYEYYHKQVRQTFAVDVPDGVYRVMTFHGDTAYGRVGKQAFWIEAEGRVAVPEVFYPPSLVTDVVFDAEVQDGRLDLTFDARDTDPARRGFVLNGLVVFPANDVRERALADRRIAAIRTDIARERSDWFAAEFKEVPHVAAGTMVPITAADRDRGFVAWTPNWMEPIYPNTLPTAGALSRQCETFATPGEYEPVAVALRALRPLKGVRAEVGNLVGPDGATIPAAALEVRSVKCWPQRIGSSWSREWRVMPELLEAKGIVDVSADTTQEFWITVHVPEGAKPGHYRGRLRLGAAEGRSWETTLRLEVLPCALAPAERVVGMYWREDRTAPELIDRQVRDMFEHGMRAVTINRPPRIDNVGGKLVVDTSELLAFLRRLRRLGLTGPIPYNHSFEDPLKRAFPKGDFNRLYVELIRALEEVSNSPDALKLVYYPVDEIGNSEKRGRKAHDLCALIAKVPGATSYVTVNKFAAGVRWGNTFDIWAGNVEYSEDQERWLLARGKRYMRYGRAYLNDSRMARSSSGFGFYRRPAEAMFYWHYQAPNGDPSNDFDGNARDWCAVYPGPDGTLIPTTDWEALREGVDDLRYIATLKSLAARAEKGSETQKSLAASARSELAAVLAAGESADQYRFAEKVSFDGYSKLRRRLAERITELATALNEERGR